jgi:hypothetical protein
MVHDLAPGEALESPRIFTGVAHGDLDSASQAMQLFFENNVFPPKLDGFPWVVYDAWGSENESSSWTFCFWIIPLGHSKLERGANKKRTYGKFQTREFEL